MPDLVTTHDLVAVGTLEEVAEQVLGGAAGVPVRGVDERAAGATEGREQVAGVLGRGVAAPGHRARAPSRETAQAGGSRGGGSSMAATLSPGPSLPWAPCGSAISCGYAGMGLGNDADNLDLVREAERLGYAAAWVAEAYGSDAPTVLAWLAGQTSTIGLGAGVMQIPARTPR